MLASLLTVGNRALLPVRRLVPKPHFRNMGTIVFIVRNRGSPCTSIIGIVGVPTVAIVVIVTAGIIGKHHRGTIRTLEVLCERLEGKCGNQQDCYQQ